jgi:hypothetical protein
VQTRSLKFVGRKRVEPVLGSRICLPRPGCKFIDIVLPNVSSDAPNAKHERVPGGNGTQIRILLDPCTANSCLIAVDAS